MTDILCTNCGSPALRSRNTKGQSFGCDINGLECCCFTCKSEGRVEQVDDGEQATLVFAAGIVED